MNGKLWLICMLISTLIISATESSAQDDFNITPLAQLQHNWMSGPLDVAVQGEYIYLACEWDGVRIVRQETNRTFTDVGHFLDDQSVRTVEVRGGWAYIDGAYETGLRILNVQNPAAPQLAATLASVTGIRKIRLYGDHAFVCTWNGLHIVNVADPLAPVVVYSQPEHTEIMDVEVHGTLAYLACDEAGLRVMDITDLAAPVIVAAYNASAGEEITGVSVANGYAFLAAGGAGMSVVNLATMQRVAQIDSFTYAFGIDVKNGFAYVHYGELECPLAVVDVANPLSPQTMGIYYPPVDLFDFEVVGNRAYIADYLYGLRILDVSNPSAPVETARHNRYGYNRDVLISGNTAFLEQEYRLVAMDITDPANPVELGDLEPRHGIRDVVLAGNLAIILQGWNQFVSIVDMSNPAASVELAQYHAEDNRDFYSVAVRGNYVYLGTASGMDILDIANPQSPVFAGSYDEGGWYESLTVGGQYLYCFDYSGRQLALDLSNPVDPQIAGQRAGSSSVDRAAAGNGYFYTANGRLIDIFSATNFANWAPLGRITLPGGSSAQVSDMFAAGNHLFVTSRDNTLNVYDVSDPAQPRLTGRRHTPGRAAGVGVSGSIAVIADGYSMGVYDCAAALPVADNPASGVTRAFALHAGYPNPFNAATQIAFELGAPQHVTLAVFDVLGRRVTTLADGPFAAGRHTIRWNGTDGAGATLASGRYYVRAAAGDAVQSMPVILLR